MTICMSVAGGGAGAAGAADSVDGSDYNRGQLAERFERSDIGFES